MKIAVDLQDNIESHNALLHEIKDTCLMLFDLWCERRGVIPLAYLMQLVASFAAVRLAGCQRHSRTCEAGWIVAKNGGYRGVAEGNIVSNANGRGATVHGAMRHPGERAIPGAGPTRRVFALPAWPVLSSGRAGA